jgi:hypothetical protein
MLYTACRYISQDADGGNQDCTIYLIEVLDDFGDDFAIDYYIYLILVCITVIRNSPAAVGYNFPVFDFSLCEKFAQNWYGLANVLILWQGSSPA